MKPLLPPPPHHRILLEPGLPPMWQETVNPAGWRTALPLPRLSALCLGLSSWGKVDHPLQAWLDDDEVVVDLLTDRALPSGLQHIQLAALKHQETELHDTLLAALTTHVARLSDSGDIPNVEDLPPRAPVADWSPWIRLNGLFLLDMPSATPYVGLDFACRWDEHGLGVLCLGTEVLAIGDRETAQDVERAAAHRQSILQALGPT